MNYSIIKYGMNIVGKSLGYIRRGDFEGLKKKIYEKVLTKFNMDVSRDDYILEKILENSAESLRESFIFWCRKQDAVAIFRYLGLEEKAKESQDELDDLHHECMKQEQNIHFSF